MAGERKPTADRQHELVDAALHLIATQGIAALTTRSLARHVGLSSGAIFKHFVSLDALLAAVVGRVEEVLDGTFPPLDLAPVERVSRFIAARAGVVGKRVGILRLVLSEQFVLALPADGSARLAAVVRRTREFLVAAVREGQRDGTIRSDVEASDLAVVIMGTVQALALLEPASREAVPPDRVLGALLNLLQPPLSPRRRKSPRTSVVPQTTTRSTR